MADDGMQQEDFISDGALKAPLQLAENMEVAARSYDHVITQAKKFADEAKKDANSITELNGILVKLQQTEQELVRVQNDNAVKLQNLVKVQEKQRKEIEELNKKLKEKKKLDEDGAKAVEALDNQTGGLITRYRTLGKEMLALASNPWVLTAAALVGTFVTLKNSVDAFYKSSGEGEDILGERMARWDAELNVIRLKWAEFGKKVNKVGEDAASSTNPWKTMFRSWVEIISPSTYAAMKEAGEVASKNFKDQDALQDDIVENLRDRALAEQLIADLTYKTGQTEIYNQKQILGFREAISNTAEEQLKKDVHLAELELDQLQRNLAARHGLSAEAFKALSLDERRAVLNEDELKELSRLTAAETKLIQLQTSFYSEQRKNEKQLNELKKKVREEEEKEALASHKKLLTDIAQMEKDFQEGVVYGFQQQEKERTEALDASAKKYADLLSEAEAYTEVQNLQAEQRALDLADFVKDLTVAFQYMLQFGNALGNIFSNLSKRRLQALDEEKTSIEEGFKKQIEAADGNEKKQERLKKAEESRIADLERRRRQELHKTAVYEKTIAIAQAIINTAVAITRVLGNPFQVASTAIIGGLQVAAIAAEPIPALFKGARKFKGGPAKVGERGFEMVNLPDGTSFLTPSKETLVNLPKGSEVVPHNETVSRLNSGAIVRVDNRDVVVELQKNRPRDFAVMYDRLYEVRRHSEHSKTYIRRLIHGRS